MRLKESLGYAIGDLGINLYFISAMTYLLLFYTDVMGLSATAAAGVIALAQGGGCYNGSADGYAG